MAYHALCLFNVGAHILLSSEPLKLFTQLLIDHFYFEHLWIELHRSVLNVEIIIGRNLTLSTLCNCSCSMLSQ